KGGPSGSSDSNALSVPIRLLRPPARTAALRGAVGDWSRSDPIIFSCTRTGTVHSPLVYCRPKTGTSVFVGGWCDERRRRNKPLNGSTANPDLPVQHRMRAHLGAVLFLGATPR